MISVRGKNQPSESETNIMQIFNIAPARRIALARLADKCDCVSVVLRCLTLPRTMPVRSLRCTRRGRRSAARCAARIAPQSGLGLSAETSRAVVCCLESTEASLILGEKLLYSSHESERASCGDKFGV